MRINEINFSKLKIKKLILYVDFYIIYHITDIIYNRFNIKCNAVGKYIYVIYFESQSII